MSKNLGGWIHNFTVTETSTHKKGYTIYKITSIIFPRAVPEALTCVTVWKRFSEVKRLYRDLYKRHKSLQLRGTIPELKDSGFFKRFDPVVIQERKDYILELLDFAAQHPALYKSYAFVNFLENGHTPNTSPLHKSNIEAICDNLDLPFESEIQLVDPAKDETQPIVNSFVLDGGNNTSKVTDDTESHKTDIIPNEEEDSASNIFTPAIFEFNDDCDYIYEAAYEFSKAVQAEVNQQYKEAVEKYKLGIDKLLTGSKNDSNEDRKAIAKAKVAKYMARAEEICEKYVTFDSEQEKQPLQLAIEKKGSDNEPFLERPWNQLSKFKVMQIIDTVMQVQDITEKKIYIMKAIEKPSTRTNAQSIFLPQNVPYMVELVGFFQSDTTIYLLLRPAKGGKLFDYISTYTPTKCCSTTLNEIFTEPEIDKIVKEEFLNVPTDNRVATTNFDSGFVELLQDYTNTDVSSHQCEDTDSINSLDDVNCAVKNIELIESDNQDYIPSFDILSQDMDVNDLVSCSEMLLKSVSSTLEQFKEVNNYDAISNDCYEQNSNHSMQNNNGNLETKEKTDIVEVKPAENLKSLSYHTNKILTYKRPSIPEPCIKQWATELIIAIESLHWKGIILGDLRPANILLGSEGQLILSYFYKSEGSDSREQIVINSESLEGYYVAPERPLTMKSDWWSFGVILFELLTGYSFRSCHPSGVYSYYEIQYPDMELSETAKNLLNRILQYSAEIRFGAHEIKSHLFFEGTVWSDVVKKGINYC